MGNIFDEFREFTYMEMIFSKLNFFSIIYCGHWELLHETDLDMLAHDIFKVQYSSYINALYRKQIKRLIKIKQGINISHESCLLFWLWAHAKRFCDHNSNMVALTLIQTMDHESCVGSGGKVGAALQVTDTLIPHDPIHPRHLPSMT